MNDDGLNIVFRYSMCLINVTRLMVSIEQLKTVVRTSYSLGKYNLIKVLYFVYWNRSEHYHKQTIDLTHFVLWTTRVIKMSNFDCLLLLGLQI